MNKIILTLAAIAALSTASFASQRNSEAPELLDRAWSTVAPVNAKALVVIKAGKTSNFEALNIRMMENETNQH